jgi:hypothetical protein
MLTYKFIAKTLALYTPETLRQAEVSLQALSCTVMFGELITEHADSPLHAKSPMTV